MTRPSTSGHPRTSMPTADKFDGNPLLSQLSVSGFTPGGPIPHGYSYLQQDVKKIRTPTRTGGDINGGMSRSASGINVPPLPRLPSFPSTPPSRPSAPPQLVRSKTTPELQRNTKTYSLDPSPVASSSSSSSSSSQLTSLLLTDPRTWTPSEVTLYLSHVLCLVPLPLLQDLHAFVRKERLGGKAFLRLREADLEAKGVNWRWRRLMTEASIRLRRDALKRRIWSGRQHDWAAPEETEDDDTSHSSDLQWSPSMQPQQRVITATLKRIKDRQYVRGAVEALESTASCDADLSYNAGLAGSPSPRPLTRHLSSASSSSSSSATSTEVKVPVKEGFVRGQAMNIASRANQGAIHRSNPSTPVRTADTEMGWNVRHDSHRANAVRSTDDSTFRPAAQLAAEESGTYDEEDLITSTESSSDTFAAPLDQTLIDAILAPDRDCHFDAEADQVAAIGYEEVMQVPACCSHNALAEQALTAGHDRSSCLDFPCQVDQHRAPWPARGKEDGKAGRPRDDWKEPNDVTISRAHGKKLYASARDIHEAGRDLANIEQPSDEHLSTCPDESAWARLQQSDCPVSDICDYSTPCEGSRHNQAEDATSKQMRNVSQNDRDQYSMQDMAPGGFTSDPRGEEPLTVDLGPNNWDSEEEEAADESQPSWEVALRGDTTDAQAQWESNFVLPQRSTPPRPSGTPPNQDVLELGEHQPGSSAPDVERPAAGEVEADVPESMPTADLRQAILDQCKAWLPFTTTEKSSTGNAAPAKTGAACENDDPKQDQSTPPPQPPPSSSLPLSSLPPYLLGLGAGVAFVIASEVLRRR
ncbi:unnamed protein product [Jaminaea pallidilutea]